MKPSNQPKRSATITGKVIVISGPSGVGKGTLCKRLIRDMPNLTLSVSATSRPAREGEVHGKDYFFTSTEEFRRMIETGGLLEWAEYNGNYYGTPKAAVKAQLIQGHHVLLEIETKGAMMVKELFPEACLIFLEAPSLEALEARLTGRQTNSAEDIASRMNIARAEMAMRDRFDFVVVNEDLDACQRKLEAIIQSLG